MFYHFHSILYSDSHGTKKSIWFGKHCHLNFSYFFKIIAYEKILILNNIERNKTDSRKSCRHTFS